MSRLAVPRGNRYGARMLARPAGSLTRRIGGFLAILSTLLFGCTRPAAESPEIPVVVVSILPLAYVVERIAGDSVRIEVMIPPGASPHAYEPTMEQMRALERARMLVQVGHPDLTFERRWADRLVGDRPGLIVVSCSDGVAPLADDPHVWLSPAAVRSMLGRVQSALTVLLPGEGRRFEEGRLRLEADIDRLDAEIRDLLAPHRGRAFWVFHPAWGYFARDYGLRQEAVEMGHKEPDAKRLGDVIAAARLEGVRRIFANPQSSQRMAELVASEVGAEVVAIDPLARDWLDNLSRVAREIAGALE
jgi:zinc transport system substrate-binding protein